MPTVYEYLEAVPERTTRAQTKNRAHRTGTRWGTGQPREKIPRITAMGPVISQVQIQSEAQIIESAMPVANICGVYFLILDGKVVYVGQSVNILSRIAGHLVASQPCTGRKRTSRRIIFDAWTWFACPETHLDVVERAYINSLLPKMNLGQLTRRPIHWQIESPVRRDPYPIAAGRSSLPHPFEAFVPPVWPICGLECGETAGALDRVRFR